MGGLASIPLTHMLDALSEHHFMEDLASTKPDEPDEGVSVLKCKEADLHRTSRPSRATGGFAAEIHRFFDGLD